jgi:hypothetical protein
LETDGLDALLKGEIRFVPCRWTGNIQVLKSLGGAVVAYGERGVSALRQTEDGRWIEMRLNDVGISETGVVAGDANGHRFLDSRGDEWMLSSDLQLKKLGGREWFTPMLAAAASIVASFYEECSEYYWCTNAKGYVATTAGLGEVTSLPTALCRIAGRLTGYSLSLADTELLLVTEAISMGNSELKTIQTLDNQVTTITNLYQSLDWRNTMGGSWYRMPYALVYRTGVYQPICTGRQFRVVLKGIVVQSDIGDSSKVEETTIRYKQTGKKTIRGTYGPTITP